MSTSVIQEVSEPASPQSDPVLHAWKTPATSALTDMFRRTATTETSLYTEEHRDVNPEGEVLEGGNGVKVNNEEGPREANSNDHATERTALLTRISSSESRYRTTHLRPRDLEGQGASGEEPSLSTARKIISWPREKGHNLAKIITNPMEWNRAAIWQNAVIAPISCLPAVALGLLLNILDALSYGTLPWYPILSGATNVKTT